MGPQPFTPRPRAPPRCQAAATTLRPRGGGISGFSGFAVCLDTRRTQPGDSRVKHAYAPGPSKSVPCHRFTRPAWAESKLRMTPAGGSDFMDAATVITTTATILISAPAAAAGVRAYRVFEGVREISCPETMEAALVRINVTRAIASRLSGGNELRLRSCSRWPGKQGCDQACLSQIAASPDGCRFRALPTRPSVQRRELSA